MMIDVLKIVGLLVAIGLGSLIAIIILVSVTTTIVAFVHSVRKVIRRK